MLVDYVCALGIAGGLRPGPIRLLERGGSRTVRQRLTLVVVVGEQLGLPVLLQVLQLRAGHLQPGRRGDGLVVGHVQRRGPGYAAPGNQLLHVPVDELHHRRVSRRGGGHAQPDRFRLLHHRLPAPRGRPDHPLPRPGHAGGRAHRVAGDVRLRDPAVLAGHGQEGADRQHRGPGGRQDLRPADRAPHLRHGLAGRDYLHAANLLRLLRLLRHGRGTGTDAGLRVHRKLQSPLRRAHDARLLAPLAHQPFQLAPRLRLYPARRQPLVDLAHVLQPGHGVLPLRGCGTGPAGRSCCGDSTTACCW